MSSFNTFQRNNLMTGTHLAAEIPSSSPERRAFVVVGAYVQTPSGFGRPSKSLNVEKDTLRFWIRKYEVNTQDIDKDITDDDLFFSIYVNDIQNIEQLERELEKYVQDFSFMEVSWKVDNPLP